MHGQALEAVEGSPVTTIRVEGLDARATCEITIFKAISGQSAPLDWMRLRGFSAATCRRVFTSLVWPSMEYGTVLVDLIGGREP